MSAMGESPPPEPKVGAVRYADDGTIEVFDGETWTPYRPPRDFDGFGPRLKTSHFSADSGPDAPSEGRA